MLDQDKASEPFDTAIRTVLFDFDGTLVFHTPDSFDVITAFCAEIGQPLSAENERQGRRTRHEYFVDPVIRDQLNDLSRDQFWQHFNRHLLEALHIEGDLGQLSHKVTDQFANLELTYECPQDGCLTLTELRARGYNLGLITNRENVPNFYRLLDSLEMRPYFDFILASGEVGISKPKPGIFHIALDRLGAGAEQALYVGDNYWADVIGARNANLTPVLFDPHRIFPEADCLVLDQISDLLTWLP